MSKESEIILGHLSCWQECASELHDHALCDCGNYQAKAALAVLDSKAGWTATQQDEINKLGWRVKELLDDLRAKEVMEAKLLQKITDLTDERHRLCKILNTILAPTDGFVWTTGMIKDYIRENNTEGDLELEQVVDEFRYQ